MRVVSHLQTVFTMDHTSQVGYARREAMMAAREDGLTAEQCERVGLVCTEMASNIVRHAGGAGVVVLRRQSEICGIELLALDKGPGIDLGRLMADRQSTSGSLGTGLGAIRRLSDIFDIHVGRSGGTAVLSQVHGPAVRPEQTLCCDLGVVCLPLAGNLVCGDGWGIADDGHTVVLMVIDGLGHGLLAADAARQAEHVFLDNMMTDPLDIMNGVDAGLTGTRGAVGLALRVVPARQKASCAGIGNIAGRIIDDDNNKRLVSYPGILGRTTRHCQRLDYEWPRDALVVVHSDGLSQRWNQSNYPGLWMRHPALIAGVLYRDHCIGNDDTTVMVMRCREPS